MRTNHTKERGLQFHENRQGTLATLSAHSNMGMVSESSVAEL